LLSLSFSFLIFAHSFFFSFHKKGIIGKSRGPFCSYGLGDGTLHTFYTSKSGDIVEAYAEAPQFNWKKVKISQIAGSPKPFANASPIALSWESTFSILVRIISFSASSSLLISFFFFSASTEFPNFDMKLAFFRLEIRKVWGSIRRMDIRHSVARDNIIEETLRIQKDFFRGSLRVSFRGEDGVGIGPHREWLSKSIIDIFTNTHPPIFRVHSDFLC
jgi:hypothetical protein